GPTPRSTRFPYPTLFRSTVPDDVRATEARAAAEGIRVRFYEPHDLRPLLLFLERDFPGDWPRLIRERLQQGVEHDEILVAERDEDRKSTRLNSSHVAISY